jgi:hypothetical protein|tara:strand:+ start:12104 stop:12427 length:324 start_codon:yes stop_codon:yes gene_type:complete
MKFYLKILLTISYLVGLAYAVTFYYIDFFLWITNNLVPFEYQNLLVCILYLPALAYLIFRIWKFKNIDKNTKGNWTVLLLFVSIVTMPIYIWRKDDIFIEENDNKRN